MVQPLRDSRDHYEELKQIDDAMSEVTRACRGSPKTLTAFRMQCRLTIILPLYDASGTEEENREHVFGWKEKIGNPLL